MDPSQLPCYLPAPPPPKVTEMEILKRLKKLKNTKSTYPIDLPSKLRQEYEYFLTLPLKEIINSCFEAQTFPSLWKVEYVTPLAKCKIVKSYNQLRKISATSDYSKLLEGIIKDYILEDIESKMDKC